MSDEKAFVNVVEAFARGGYYLFVGNILATVILFVSSIVIANLLGPENYGLFSLVIVVPSLFIGLSDFGVTSAVTKFLAEFRAKGRKSDIGRVIKSGLVIQLAIAVIASIICFVFSDKLSTYVINSPEATGYVKIASLLILFQSLFNVLSAIFVGLDKMENNAVIMIIRAIAKLFLSAVLLLIGLSVSGAVVGHVSCYIVAVFLGLAFLIFKLPRNSGNRNPRSDILKSMLKYGFPIYGAGLIGLFSVQYQTVIMAFFTSKAAIGNYQVTSLFNTVLNTVIYPFTALFPAFSKLDPHGKQLNQFFSRSVKYTALLLIPLAVAIIVMSKDLIFTFYGPDYVLAPTFVVITMLGCLSAGVGSRVFQYLFKGVGRTDVILKSTLINLFVLIPLIPLLTMLYDIVGLIVATLISSWCGLIYVSFNAFKKLKLSIDIWSSAKIYVASAISALFPFVILIVSPFNGIINLIFGGTIFILTYLTLLPIIGVLNATDIEIFRLQFHKIKSVWPIIKLLLSYERKVLERIKKSTR